MSKSYSDRRRYQSKSSKHGRNDNLYLFNILFACTYTISVFLLTLLVDNDISAYASIAPYIYAELGVHTGFYIWKCKVENCRKYKDVNKLTDLEREILEDDEFTY